MPNTSSSVLFGYKPPVVPQPSVASLPLSASGTGIVPETESQKKDRLAQEFKVWAAQRLEKERIARERGGQ